MWAYSPLQLTTSQPSQALVQELLQTSISALFKPLLLSQSQAIIESMFYKMSHKFQEDTIKLLKHPKIDKDSQVGVLMWTQKANPDSKSMMRGIMPSEKALVGQLDTNLQALIKALEPLWLAGTARLLPDLRCVQLIIYDSNASGSFASDF